VIKRVNLKKVFLPEIKVEAGIPIPPIHYQSYSRIPQGFWTKTLEQMNVGDSFVAERKWLTNIRDAAMMMKMKILSRHLDEARARVWRIK